MSKEDKSISKLVEESNIDFEPTWGHFFVRMTQEEVDAEKKRLEKEFKEIQANEARKGDKVLVKNKSEEKERNKFFSVIANHPNVPIKKVYKTASDVTVVKPGDRVVIREGANPERFKYGIYFYFAYSEKSISGIVKESK